MFFALYGVVSFLVCWKLGDWRKWKQYYPTILFFMMGSLVNDYLTFTRPLWLYDGIFGKYIFLSISVMSIAYPGTVILYLSHYPDKLVHQVLYVLGWSAAFCLIEYLSRIVCGFQHLNGWNMLYTCGFDIIMFAMLRLHHRKPLWAWPISAALAFLVLWWFRIPLAR